MLESASLSVTPPELVLSQNRAEDQLIPRKLTIFNNVPTLDGWRAVAVISVVLYHWLSLTLPIESHASHLVSRGRFGVDIFFAISGFLICGRLLQDLRNDRSVHLKYFYTKRAFRILPPILVYLSALAVLMFLGWTRTQEWEFTSTLLFVRNYFPLFHDFALGRYTAQFWSLAVEEHFYLVWPFALLLLGRRMRTAAWVTVSLALAVFVWRVCDNAGGWFIPFGIDTDAKTDTRFDSLLWGCLAAFAYVWLHENKIHWERYRNAWKMVLPVVLVITYFQWAPGASLYRAALFPLLILSTALVPETHLGHFLGLPVVRWIGRLSYSIYIWQQLFLFPTLAEGSPLQHLQQFPFNFLGIIAAATGSYYLVERPMVRYGHRIVERWKTNEALPSGRALPVTAAARSFAR